jgi:outer membrane protein TolC
MLFLSSEMLIAQELSLTKGIELQFEEYLGYVKQHHPLVKQAGLLLSEGEATLLSARGGFDPKIEVDYDRKKFKNTEYYDQLNAAFKIPTWYGIELKANFEENTGEFLDPSFSVPNDGLFSAGVSLSLAQGLLINERMADLKKARFFRAQTKAERDLLVTKILYDASKAYFDWVETTIAEEIFESFVSNATRRLDAVKRSAELGESATIDITEARIILQNRLLNLEDAKLKRRKAALRVSNFLWINNIPMELQNTSKPVLPEIENLSNLLSLSDVSESQSMLSEHPKLLTLDAKIGQLKIDRSFKRNKLLPKIDVQYNFLTPQWNEVTSLNTANYKAFVNVKFPLFLRKERGDVQLANLKLNDANYERLSTTLAIQNKIGAIEAEISSLVVQNSSIDAIVVDYTSLVAAEERKFVLGESSLFLINSREQKLIDAQLKQNKLRVKQLDATASLFKTL